jgi:hypothetical protein
VRVAIGVVGDILPQPVSHNKEKTSTQMILYESIIILSLVKDEGYDVEANAIRSEGIHCLFTSCR